MPTTADAVSWEPGSDDARAREARRPRRGRARSGPRTVPGCDDLGQDPGRDAEALQHRPGPVARDGVEALAGASRSVYSATALPDRKWANRSAIISSRSAWRSSGSSGADHREQLVQRVDGHELDAGGARRSRRAARSRRRRSGMPVRPRVAVVDRVREQPAAVVEQPEVHAPGVHADARRPGPPAPARRRPAIDVAEQAQEVPVERARERHRDVGEAVDVLEGQAAAVEGADDGPAALGAEIDAAMRSGRRQSRRKTSSEPELPSLRRHGTS